MNKRKFLIISIVLIVFVAIVFIVISGRPSKVESIKLSLSDFQERVLGVGRMNGGTEIQFKSEISGTVVTSNFNEGDSLEKGDVILVIDGGDQQFALDEKKAAYLNAQAQFQNLTEYQLPTAKGKSTQSEFDKNIALDNYNDAKALFAEGAISKNSLMESENRYQTALSTWDSAVLSYKALSPRGSSYLEGQAQLAAAKASYEKAQAQLAKYSVVALEKSILLKKYVEVGNYVQPGQSIADIGTLDNPYISTELDERYFPYIKTGMDVLIFVDTSSKYKGKVASVSPKINDATGGFTLKIEPTEDLPYKASNLTVNIEIALISVPKAISLPESYILRDGSGSYVWLYKGGTVIKTKIVADAALSGNVLIKSGLNEGDIVAKPQADFIDGMKVSI